MPPIPRPKKVTVTLSPEQQAVVDHRGSDLQVIACAGSGKTEAISRRVASLIVEGTSPDAIVAFTFTERAAAELKDRIVRRVSEAKGAAFRDRLGPMFVGTIHAYCFRLLQDYVPKFGNWDLLDENRHVGLLSREFRTIGLDRLGGAHWASIRSFGETIGVLENEHIHGADLPEPLAGCVREYRALLTRYQLLTYGSLITEAIGALSDPAVFTRVHSRLRHLLVDEYQDINPSQERLIARLAAPPVQLCVVGDDDQSIYQWRGSDIANILTFQKRRNAKAIVLDTNRRSRPAIVQAAAEFAESIPQRLDKTMKAARPASEAAVVAFSEESNLDEAERVAGTIKALHEAGHAWRDIAVLFRSVRTASPPLLDALDALEIPYDCGGRTGLFLRPDIAVFGAIVAWFVEWEWKNARFGERETPTRDGIVETLRKHFPHAPSPRDLAAYLDDWKRVRLDVARGPADLVDDYYRLLALLGAHRISPDDPAGAARLGAFARFSEVLADFENVHRRGYLIKAGANVAFEPGRGRGTFYYRALANYLTHWANEAYEDFAGEPAADLDAVAILTIHQAKGLEWPVVFLPSLIVGRFPSKRAGSERDWQLPEDVFPKATRARYEGGDGEERRLFYVAMTRARDQLYVSWFERMKRRANPSPYVVDLARAFRRESGDIPVPPATKADQKPPPALELSFSDLARLDECGYAYRLGTLFGFQQSLAPELGYGRAVHHVLRLLAEQAVAGAVPSAADVTCLVDREMYLPFATISAWQQMRAAAERLVRAYTTEYAHDFQRIWAVERPFALHFDEGIVSGRADVILDEHDGQIGRLAIVDYKTSHDEDRDERYHLQLQIYAAAGRGEGLVVDGAFLHELREGERVPVDIDVSTVAAATVRARALLKRAQAGDYAPKPEAARCRTCGFCRICHHAAVSEARRAAP